MVQLCAILQYFKAIIGTGKGGDYMKKLNIEYTGYSPISDKVIKILARLFGWKFSASGYYIPKDTRDLQFEK